MAFNFDNLKNYWEIFYNFTAYRVVSATQTDEIGDDIKVNSKGESFKCDIQPVQAKDIEEVWGNDIDAQFNLYCDVDFETGDLISWNDKVYKVIDHKKWSKINKLYAIKECDVKCT